MARYSFPIPESCVYRYSIGKRVVEIDRNDVAITGTVKAVHMGKPGGVALVEIEVDASHSPCVPA